ncbi:MAG: polyphosphate kinase 2 [Proteobacteria bacterium]|nr:polyphosphate kinase 2 [Pseudomonadota bacterium]
MGKLKRKHYEHALEPMQLELVQMARWLQHTGKRLVVVVEGRDTAGKGGVIDAIMQHLNPRQVHHVALPKPDDREQTEWYFQRYVQALPAGGEIALFDRSWYNRAGVEKVMGFATPDQVAAFLRQAPVFEKQLVDDGILLFKYWLCCDQVEQEKRFAERSANPLKGWKLSPIDVKAREQYAAYTNARESMLKTTHSKHAPWTLVDFNDQKLGRLTLIRDLLDRLPDTRIPDDTIKLAALGGKLHRERYGTLKPIKSFKA